MIHVDVPDSNIENLMRVFRIAHEYVELTPFTDGTGKRHWTVSTKDTNRDLLERAYSEHGQVTAKMLETTRAHLAAGRKNDAIRYLRHATGWPLSETVSYINAL